MPPSEELLSELNKHKCLLSEELVIALEYSIDELEKELKRIEGYKKSESYKAYIKDANI